jgi:hypothetical protein
VGGIFKRAGRVGAGGLKRRRLNKRVFYKDKQNYQNLKDLGEVSRVVLKLAARS